ncbi:MAG: Flp pilus assembly complex ATPase component TadA [Candidatus Eremiobacteraeota bacterium]|nr:Flp pilus assembly complex ATPase component TadA [Candidatus Eremiobacteraeota bacterium]MCW5867259.1 Flp pilus assembly complex ATPase component TadA [Candidatus Eremiobacteraeota bacterium]
MARRRRRRPGDSVEGDDSLLEDDDDDLDIRVTSIEEELQNLLLSTQESVRDQRAVRAKLDKLAREFEEDAEGDDELFQELDGLKTQTVSQLEQLTQAQRILTERVAEITERLANVGGNGPLENVPGKLEELVAQVHQSVQQRFQTQDATREEEMDLVATRLEELAHNLEAQTSKLRESLADQSKFEALSREIDTTLADLSSKFKSNLAEVSQQQQASQQELEANLAELADAVDSRAGQEDIAELKSELEALKATYSNQSELGARATQAVSRVEQLESLLQQQGERYEQLLGRSKTLADETEKFSDKVDLAVRLVKALDERGRGGAPADLGATPGISVSDADLEAPEKTDLNFGLRDLLNVMSQNQASDLHIKVGSNPMVRLHGDLIPVGNNSLGEEDCRRLIFFALSKEERRRLLQQRSLDFTYEQSGLRLRGHAFYQRGRLCASMKMLRSQTNLEELGLPAILRRTVSTLKHGMVLVTGPLGSGKSTTLSAIVDELNRTRKMHILSLEAPIHIIHQDQQSLITQREFGSDYQDTVKAIQDGLKHDPDALIIDPLPNAEAAATAVAAADSGHLVVAGLEAPNLLSALERLMSFVDRAPNLVDRRQLAYNLKAVVSLRLLPRADKSKGLVPAAEVLLVNQAVSQLLAEGNLDALSQTVNKGLAGEGSQTMSQSLSRLIDTGMISEAEAANLLPAASNGHAGLAEDAPLMRWL